MLLDLNTLVITEALILIQLALLVHVAGRRIRNVCRGPAAWALGLLGLALSELAFVLVDDHAWLGPRALSHLPAALGCAAMLIGLDDFADRPRNWRGAGLLVAMSVLDLIGQIVHPFSPQLRISSFTLLQLLFIGFALPRLYQPVSGQRRLGFKLMRSLAWLWGLVNLLRLGVAWMLPESSSDGLGLISLAYFLCALGLGIWLALGCMLLMHERLSAGLIHATTRDNLTGCLNGRGLATQVQQESQRLVRNWAPTAVLRFAIDDYPGLLRRYGHAAGEQSLLALAELARAELRDVDALARLEGEQFAIVLLNANLAGATIVAERLRRRVADLVIYSAAGPIWFTASFGVAGLPELETELELVLRQADRALQQASSGGGSQIVAQAVAAPAH